jgi:ribosomal protein S18
MTTNYLIKNKKNSLNVNKERINWDQSLHLLDPIQTSRYNFKKSLCYILLLRKLKNVIDFKNIKFLQIFLNKSGKIRSRRKTRISSYNQRTIAKAIKKARATSLIPYTCNVNL